MAVWEYMDTFPGMDGSAVKCHLIAQICEIPDRRKNCMYIKIRHKNRMPFKGILFYQGF